MAWKHFIITFFFLSTTVTHAAAPVTLSGPVPGVASDYQANTSQTVIFTVTNNVPQVLPLSISGISAPLSRTTVTNDCGNHLPRGPATCQIGVLIAPTSSNAGQTIQQTFSVNYAGRTPLTQNFRFTVSETAGAPPVLLAMGEDFSAIPLLVVSTDNALTWSRKTSGLPTSGWWWDGSCTKDGTDIVCAVAGQVNFAGTPLLATSTDGGNTWTQKTISGASTTIALGDASCTGNGTSAICIAAGPLNGGEATIGLSTDGGNTWAKAPIALPNPGALRSTSCTGSGTTAVCVAVGQDDTGNFLIAVGSQGATNWSIIPGLPAGILRNVSCTGSGSTAVCAAASIDTLIVSTDGGATWQTKALSPSPSRLITTSCTGSGASAICLAAGDLGNYPQAYLSQNGAVTWADAAMTGLPQGTFYGSSCTGQGATAVCMAVGENDDNSYPLIFVSQNGGASWTNITTIQNGPQGYFEGGSCATFQNTATCIAVGYNYDDGFPLLVVSTNNGVNWQKIDVPGVDSDGIYFSGGSGGGSGFAIGHKKYGLTSALSDHIKIGASHA